MQSILAKKLMLVIYLIFLKLQKVVKIQSYLIPDRQFKERTGVNPKLYERIIRFDKAFRVKNSQPRFDWLRIAVECGYHDYQHLSKAYKDFTGLTPTGFHALEEKAPERLFGLSEGFYKRE